MLQTNLYIWILRHIPFQSELLPYFPSEVWDETRVCPFPEYCWFILFLRLLLKPRFIFTWGKCSHLWKYWQNSNSASIWHKSLLSLCAQIDIALVRRLPRLCLTSPFCFPFSLFQSPRMPFNFYLWLCFHCQCSGRGISSIWQLQDALAVLKAASSLTSLRT